MAVQSSTSREAQTSKSVSHDHFFVWREFVWGAVAGAFGEGMMHPVDTIKTRIQSQAILNGVKNQKSILQMVRTVWQVDGLRGFYRGVIPGITGSLATGATYFGVIESTKKWIEDSHPSLGGHWAHFIAGAVGDTLGSFVYVPCEVIKQRMQVQGTVAIKPGAQLYDYYTGMFHAGCSIWKTQGLKGLYAGYLSTLARDVPFAGLMVVFYEALKDVTEYGKQRWISNPNWHVNNSFEGLVLGGLAGGLSAYLTTPLDVVKTRLQVQGSTFRYPFFSITILTGYGIGDVYFPPGYYSIVFIAHLLERYAELIFWYIMGIYRVITCDIPCLSFFPYHNHEQGYFVPREWSIVHVFYGLS